MPPLHKSLYSLGRYFTGSIVLLGLGYPALAAGYTIGVGFPEARTKTPPVGTPVEVPVEITAPQLAQAALTYLPVPPSSPISPEHSPAAGAWVPWNVAQALPAPSGWSTPAPGLPAGAYAPPSMPYPGAPYQGGMWMMVWMPTYAPMGPGSPGMPTPPSGYMQPVPGGLPQGGVGPGQSPGAMSPYPTAMVAIPWGLPYGYGLPAIPAVGYPNGPGPMAAPLPYGNTPFYGGALPYGAMPPNGSAYFYGAPQAYGAQAYGAQAPYNYSAPIGSAPLAVPALPGGSAAVAPPPPMADPWPQLGAPPVQTALPGTPTPGIYAPALNPGVAQGGLAPMPLPSQTMGVNPVTLGPEPGLSDAQLPDPRLDIQGLYVLQGDRSSARARLSGDAFLTPNLLVGGRSISSLALI